VKYGYARVSPGGQLRRVIETLEPDDVLMVTRLDRLARSTRELLPAAVSGGLIRDLPDPVDSEQVVEIDPAVGLV